MQLNTKKGAIPAKPETSISIVIKKEDAASTEAFANLYYEYPSSPKVYSLLKRSTEVFHAYPSTNNNYEFVP